MYEETSRYDEINKAFIVKGEKGDDIIDDWEAEEILTDHINEHKTDVILPKYVDSAIKNYFGNTSEMLGRGYGTSYGLEGNNVILVKFNEEAGINIELKEGGIYAILFDRNAPAGLYLKLENNDAKQVLLENEEIKEGAITSGDTVIFMYDGNVFRLLCDTDYVDEIKSYEEKTITSEDIGDVSGYSIDFKSSNDSIFVPKKDYLYQNNIFVSTFKNNKVVSDFLQKSDFLVNGIKKLMDFEIVKSKFTYQSPAEAFYNTVYVKKIEELEYNIKDYNLCPSQDFKITVNNNDNNNNNPEIVSCEIYNKDELGQPSTKYYIRTIFKFKKQDINEFFDFDIEYSFMIFKNSMTNYLYRNIYKHFNWRFFALDKKEYSGIIKYKKSVFDESFVPTSNYMFYSDLFIPISINYTKNYSKEIDDQDYSVIGYKEGNDKDLYYVEKPIIKYYLWKIDEVDPLINEKRSYGFNYNTGNIYNYYTLKNRSSGNNNRIDLAISEAIFIKNPQIDDFYTEELVYTLSIPKKTLFNSYTQYLNNKQDGYLNLSDTVPTRNKWSIYSEYYRPLLVNGANLIYNADGLEIDISSSEVATQITNGLSITDFFISIRSNVISAPKEYETDSGNVSITVKANVLFGNNICCREDIHGPRGLVKNYATKPITYWDNSDLQKSKVWYIGPDDTMPKRYTFDGIIFCSTDFYDLDSNYDYYYAGVYYSLNYKYYCVFANNDDEIIDYFKITPNDDSDYFNAYKKIQIPDKATKISFTLHLSDAESFYFFKRPKNLKQGE